MTKKKVTHEDESDRPRSAKGTYAAGGTITPEHQKKMQEARTGTGVTQEELIEDAGYTMDTAPPALKIAASKAAKGDISALRVWLQQSRQLEPAPRTTTTKAEAPKHVMVMGADAVAGLVRMGIHVTDTCPECGHVFTLFEDGVELSVGRYDDL